MWPLREMSFASDVKPDNHKEIFESYLSRSKRKNAQNQEEDLKHLCLYSAN